MLKKWWVIYFSAVLESETPTARRSFSPAGPRDFFLSSHTEVELFCRRFQTFAKTLQPRIQGSGGNETFLPPAQTESTGSFTVFPNLILQLVSSLC